MDASLAISFRSLLIPYGWLSFNLGAAPRIAHLAEQVMQGFDWHANFALECGGRLLYYNLTQFLGKKHDEAKRLADAGYTFSQEDIWTYRINRGCLYLRVGRIAEAEQLLREAEPHISKRRRLYRMFAKEALEEVEQWKRSATSPQHQLDWRWVERFRALSAYDSYWWLAPTGLFTETEQQEWERLFTPGLDEATKLHLGTLMMQSVQHEVQSALYEQREPRFHYPALDIENVRTRITDLLQLDNEVMRDEPNALVRRFYHDAIAEELDFLRLIEAIHEGNAEHFWQYMQRLVPVSTPEEMQYALLRVRRDLVHGLLRSETQEASRRFNQMLREDYGIILDLSYTEEEAQELLAIVPSSHSQVEPKVTVLAAKRFFEAVFREIGFDEWHVAIDPNVDDARVEQGLRCLFLGENSLSVQRVKHLLVHELAGHVARCIAGERSLLGLLGIHTKNSLETEEGIVMYHEVQEEKQQGNGYPERWLWSGTLATGLASGVISPPQTFRSVHAFFEELFFLRRRLRQLDPDEETARRRAQQVATSRCLRTFRGVPDLTHAGICYTQDVLYLRGLWTIEQALKKDEHVLGRLAVGVVSVEQLADLQELGIVHAPEPLRTLAEDPHLSEYILSFEQTGQTN